MHIPTEHFEHFVRTIDLHFLAEQLLFIFSSVFFTKWSNLSKRNVSDIRESDEQNDFDIHLGPVGVF